MAHVQKTVVTLRIVGDNLVPTEISSLLGASPTEAYSKGEQIGGPKKGPVRIARKGVWRLCASDRSPEDLDGQIQEVLGQMTDDLTNWRSITDRYDVDLFCGLFLGGFNEGLSISAQSLAELGLRGIELGLDIYGVEKVISEPK